MFDSFFFFFFNSFHPFVDVLISFMPPFPDFAYLSVFSCRSLSFFTTRILNCQVIHRSPLLSVWFLEAYLVPLTGTSFLVCSCTLRLFAEFHAFEKRVTSPSLYRLALFRGRPPPISPARDSGASEARRVGVRAPCLWACAPNRPVSEFAGFVPRRV